MKNHYVFFLRCLSIFLLFLGINPSFATSISVYTPYPAFCTQAASDSKIFANFKNHPVYQQTLEHVSFESGQEYLRVILEEFPDVLTHLEKFKKNDLLGNPNVYDFGDIGVISPTTLRYIKVAGDLREKFGDLSQMHIVEIGAGYGGQCKIIADLCGFASYTIIDLAECNTLTKVYLEKLGVEDVHFLANTELEKASSYDLVISNYAFSEIDEEEQLEYLEKVVCLTKNGYMTLNYISDYYDLVSLPIEDVIEHLSQSGHEGKTVEERPLTFPDNVILTWSPPISAQY